MSGPKRNSRARIRARDEAEFRRWEKLAERLREGRLAAKECRSAEVRPAEVR